MTFDRPDAPHEPAQTVSRGAWLEWTSPAASLDFDGAPLVTRRDRKPANALMALRRKGDHAGFVDAPRRELLEASGLDRNAWARAVASIEEAGYVRTWTVAAGRVQETRYQLTDSGIVEADRLTDERDRLKTHAPPAHEPVGEPVASRSEPLFSSKYSLSGAEGKEEPTKDSDSDRLTTGSPARDRLMRTIRRQALTIDRQARIIETLVARLDASHRCSCGAPTKPRKNGKGEWFDGCSLWPNCPAKTKNSDEKKGKAAARQEDLQSIDQRTPEEISAERRGVRPRRPVGSPP